MGKDAKVPLGKSADAKLRLERRTEVKDDKGWLIMLRDALGPSYD